MFSEGCVSHSSHQRGGGEGAYVAGGMRSWGTCDCGGICGCTRCVWLEGNVCGWGQAWLGAHTRCVLSGGKGYAVWGMVCCLRGGVWGGAVGGGVVQVVCCLECEQNDRQV